MANLQKNAMQSKYYYLWGTTSHFENLFSLLSMAYITTKIIYKDLQRFFPFFQERWVNSLRNFRTPDAQ